MCCLFGKTFSGSNEERSEEEGKKERGRERECSSGGRCGRVWDRPVAVVMFMSTSVEVWPVSSPLCPPCPPLQMVDLLIWQLAVSLRMVNSNRSIQT